MQSYEHHIVHESLEMRHPYLQDPFSSEVDPQQITVAVFDRMVHKFREVLSNEEQDPELICDALKTLNELVHHQETCDQMIDNEILPITSELLKREQPEVREQAALLLGSFALSAIGRQLFDFAFPNLRELLEDESYPVREAASWAFKQLTQNDDGCQRVVESTCPGNMIESFIRHSNEDAMEYQDAQYLINLLEAFANLTFSDFGIEPLLGTGAIPQFTKLLDNQYARDVLDDHYEQIGELCLRTLGNMSINHEGKDECINHKVIARTYEYLAEKSREMRLQASLILMSCSIHLEGKHQIVNMIDDEGNPLIIVAIIKILQSQQFPVIRNNLKVCLTNVAELPKGFSDITRQLIEKIAILDEVFGPRAVKPLHNFLPKLSDYDQMLQIDPMEILKGVMVIRALAVLFKKYQEEAAQVAIDETINFAEKLVPFVDPDHSVAKEVFICLYEILPLDPFNCHILQKFILKYGDVPLSNDAEGRTFKMLISQEYSEIFQLAMEARILT